MDTNLVGTASVDLSLSRKLPENWGIELVRCLKNKPGQQIYEGINTLGQRYVLRIQTYSQERERLWKTLSRYRLPHVGEIVDCQCFNDSAYVLERYYEGESLLTAAESGRSFGLRQMLLSLIKITQDLSTLYEQEGLLHLDIKPENLWVDAYDNVTLLDFGAALTAVHETDLMHIPQYGTPSFAAPERWQSPNQVGPPADLFSLTEVLKWWLGIEGIGSYDLWHALNQWQQLRHRLAEELTFPYAGHRRALEAYATFENLLLQHLA